MIKAKTLPKVLAQACTGGIECAMIFDLQGSLLSFSGGEDINSTQMVAAIVSNFWGAFEAKQPGMEFMLMDFEKGRIAATRTSAFVLCLYGSDAVPLGMLKSKATALADYLAAPLEEVVRAQ